MLLNHKTYNRNRQAGAAEVRGQQKPLQKKKNHCKFKQRYAILSISHFISHMISNFEMCKHNWQTEDLDEISLALTEQLLSKDVKPTMSPHKHCD